VELSHNSLNTEGVKNVSKKLLKKIETCAVSRSFYEKFFKIFVVMFPQNCWPDFNNTAY
jgi:hypothetical protein